MKRMQVSLSDAQHRTLEAMAKSLGGTMAELIRRNSVPMLRGSDHGY
jgi:hypothetical protein